MAFLDEIDKKLTRLGQGALQRTRDVSDTAKIAASIRTLESQKKNCLEKLGEQFLLKYEMYAGEEEQIFIQRIRNVDLEIKQLHDEMNRIKGWVNCPNCNTGVPINSRFCSSCGFNMEGFSTGVNSPEIKVKCNKCGTVAGDGQVFCMNCGNHLGNQNFNENAYANAEIIEENTQQANIKSSIKCKACGEEIEDGMAFCVFCGTAV